MKRVYTHKNSVPVCVPATPHPPGAWFSGTHARPCHLPTRTNAPVGYLAEQTPDLCMGGRGLRCREAAPRLCALTG